MIVVWLSCGHELTFNGQYTAPRRHDYVYCIRCGHGSYVRRKDGNRRKAAA